MDEDTALKAAGCKSFGGSIPSSSAKKNRVMKNREVLTGKFESSKVRLRQEPKVVNIKFRLIKKLIKRLQK